MDQRIKRPKLIRALALLLSIVVITLGLFGASRIKTSFSMEIFGLSNETEVAQYQSLQSRFAKNKELIIIGFRSQSPINQFNEFFSLQNLVDSLDETNLFNEVHFLTTINYPRKKGLFVKQTKFLPLTTKSQFELAYSQLWLYPDITEKFVSKDHKSVCIYAFLKEKDLSQKEIADLNKLINSVGSYETFVVGNSFNQQQAREFLKLDALKMTAISFGIIILLFFVFYPSIKQLLFFAWELLFCVGAFYLLIYLLNIELNVLTISIPIIITTLSLSDTVHIISVSQSAEPSRQLENFLRIKTPLFLSTVTTIAGFAVFVITKNSVIIEFSLLASLGLITSFLIARFWSPNLFWLLRSGKKMKANYWDVFSLFILRILSKRAKTIVVVFLLLSAGAFAFVFSKLKVDSFLSDHIDKRIEPGRSLSFYQENFTGPRQLEMFIECDSSLFTTEQIAMVNSIEEYLLYEYGAVSCQSISTCLKRLERFMHNGSPEKYELPDSLDKRVTIGLKKYWTQLGANGVLSTDMKTLRIVATTADVGSKRAIEKNKALQVYLKSILPKNQTFYIGGPTTISDQANINISNLLMWGLGAGIMMVVLFLLFYFQSPWIAFAGGIVNILPLLAVFLFYAIVERKLGPNDFMLLSILLGVAIDDSIHFLSRIKTTSHSISYSLQSVIQPMVVSSLLLIGGFSALLFSFSPDNRLNGIAFIIGISMALITDLILLPALLIVKNKSNYLPPN